ncbi:MAG: hypothetical protein IPK58_10275 [Acidobacteria bacterium]|nr:hypothetical protein [Acidobacteriota bacterium]
MRSVDEFVSGSDNFRLHRQLYAATRLLNKKTALPKVLELMQSAIGTVDAALDVPNPSAAVLADELYDSRQYFIARSQLVSVNELPRPKLSFDPPRAHRRDGRRCVFGSRRCRAGDRSAETR